MEILAARHLFEDRFWASVNKTDACWVWTRTKVGTMGYGQFNFRHKNYRAHRLSYSMVFGTIGEGLVVRHKCHEPACIRPDHLQLGTMQDNVNDAVKAGRHSRGERHGVVMRARKLRGENHTNAKLTVEQVVQIRYLHDNGLAVTRELGEEFGVSRSCIEMITSRRNWRHV